MTNFSLKLNIKFLKLYLTSEVIWRQCPELKNDSVPRTCSEVWVKKFRTKCCKSGLLRPEQHALVARWSIGPLPSCSFLPFKSKVPWILEKKNSFYYHSDSLQNYCLVNIIKGLKLKLVPNSKRQFFHEWWTRPALSAKWIWLRQLRGTDRGHRQPHLATKEVGFRIR